MLALLPQAWADMGPLLHHTCRKPFMEEEDLWRVRKGTVVQNLCSCLRQRRRGRVSGREEAKGTG